MMDGEIHEALISVAVSLRMIADAMIVANQLEQAKFDRQYPVRSEPRNATVTKVKTQEDRLREDQGQSGESLDDWIQLREQAHLSPKEPAK